MEPGAAALEGLELSEAPEITVAVPSHDRALRLRWLLNALEDQTIDRARFEIVVAHDSADDTGELLRTHPLAGNGTLRALEFEPGSKGPAEKRNEAWRAARAPLVVFTDDDCRPPADWLERAVEAARRNPGCIVQGQTKPDPDEEPLLDAPRRHSVWVDPPTPWAETCNIVYPRDVLERVNGFPEDLWTGEDTDLAWRAIDAGAGYVGAPEVLTYHCVEVVSLRKWLRGLDRWEDVPGLLKRHPERRRHYPLWIFWKRSHVWLPPAALGALLARRNPLWLLLAIPYLIHAMPRSGGDPRGRVRSLLELPGWTAIHLKEMAVLARGSVKHRTLLL